MGAVVVFIVIASILLMRSTNLALGWEPESTVSEISVGGKVQCQDCYQSWNHWVQGANPINGSVVSVTCMDRRSRVVHYASDVTDKFGQFKLKINLNIYGKKLDPKQCWARLVSSPDPTCDIFTNFGGGKTGVRLSRPSSIYHDNVEYLLGPFYFTSRTCEKPDTSDSQDYGNQNKGHY